MSQPQLSEVLQETIQLTQEYFEDARKFQQSSQNQIRALAAELNVFQQRFLEIERGIHDQTSNLLQKITTVNARLQGFLQGNLIGAVDSDKTNSVGGVRDTVTQTELRNNPDLDDIFFDRSESKSKAVSKAGSQSSSDLSELTPSTGGANSQKESTQTTQQSLPLTENPQTTEPTKSPTLTPTPSNAINEESTPSRINRTVPAPTQPKILEIIQKHQFFSSFYNSVVHLNQATKFLESDQLFSPQEFKKNTWKDKLIQLAASMSDQVKYLEDEPRWITAEPQSSWFESTLSDFITYNVNNYTMLESNLEYFFYAQRSNIVNLQSWWRCTACLQIARDYLINFLNSQGKYKSVLPQRLLDTKELEALEEKEKIKIVWVRCHLPINTQIHILARGFSKKNGEVFECKKIGKIMVSGGNDAKLMEYELPPTEIRYSMKKS